MHVLTVSRGLPINNVINIRATMKLYRSGSYRSNSKHVNAQRKTHFVARAPTKKFAPGAAASEHNKATNLMSEYGNHKKLCNPYADENRFYKKSH